MSAPRWLQHPVTVFLVPLVTFICLPRLYEFLPHATDPSYDDAKLQSIATLMEDVYDVLANSTFIPQNAITRGPHIINTTAISCKPSGSVLRLVELLPYVDISLVQEPDWIYGGWFMDYRNPAHLAELCDPLRGESIGWTDYMEPNDIALTNWGTGGWNNDRTWVLIYNTERDSIRIFDAELWLCRKGAKRDFGGEMEDWWFEDSGQFVWDRADGASHVLRAIVNSYRKLKWTPWATSNREDGFGASSEMIKGLLQRNGWPDSFDSTQFRVDFIHATHTPPSHDSSIEAQTHIDKSRFQALQRTIEEARYTNDTKQCVHRLKDEPSTDPTFLEKCLTNKAAEQKWLDLSFEQSRDEMLMHCKDAECDSLPFEDVFERARNKIVELELMIEDHIAELQRREVQHRDQIPELDSEAQDEIERQNSRLAHARWGIVEEVEMLREELAKLERGETAEKGRKWLFNYLRDYEED